MPVVLRNTLDVTDRVLSIAENRSSFNTVEGQLAASKNYVLQDDDGAISFLTGLYFSDNWRNTEVDETNDAGQVIFDSLVGDVGLSKTDDGFLTQITGKSVITSLLQWAVESNLSDTTFLTAGAASAGDTVINIDTGAVIIDTPALATFSDSLVPRYHVVEQTDNGSATTSIRLDRGLEQGIADNTPIRFTFAEVKTAAQEIFDVLTAVNAEASVNLQVGPSFAQINAADTAASALIWVHVRIEDGIKLKDHLAQVLEMADLFLTVSETGVIDIVRGREYGGELPVDEITESEIKIPWSMRHDDSQLVIGYDCLYIDTTADPKAVKVAAGDVTQELIDTYKGRNRWQPVPLQGSSANPFEYGVLYASATSADFFGERRLDYFGYPRIRLKSPMKQHFSRQPLNRIVPQLGKTFALTLDVSIAQTLIQEPTICMGFAYSDQNLAFDTIELELTNYPSPNLVVNRTFLPAPVVLSITGRTSGFQAQLEAFTGELFADVYLEDKVFRVLHQISCGSGNSAAALSNSLLTTGQRYFVRFYQKGNGFTSAETDFIEFTPTRTVRVTSTGDRRVTSTGDVRVI